jgi:hypothetical protein
VTGNLKIKDQDMSKPSKLIDIFVKINDNYTVTNCHNGFVIEVSGQDRDAEWITAKYVIKSLDELKDAVQDLAWMQRC